MILLYYLFNLSFIFSSTIVLYIPLFTTVPDVKMLLLDFKSLISTDENKAHFLRLAQSTWLT